MIFLKSQGEEINEFVKRFDDELLHKARDLVKYGGIVSTRINEHLFEFSNTDFKAQIAVDETVVKEWVCTCIIFANGNICKHAVASALLLNELLESRKSLNKKKNKTLGTVISELATEDKDLVLKYILKKNPIYTEIINFQNKSSTDDLFKYEQQKEFLKNLIGQLPNDKTPKKQVQKKLDSLQLCFELFKNSTNSIRDPEKKFFLLDLIPISIRINSLLKNRRTTKFVEDIHKEIFLLTTILAAPELKYDLLDLIKLHCRNKNYNYVGKYSLFESLNNANYLERRLFDKALKIFADTDLSEISKSTLSDLLHNQEYSIPQEFSNTAPEKSLSFVVDVLFDFESIPKLLELIDNSSDKNYTLQKILLENTAKIESNALLKKHCEQHEWYNTFKNISNQESIEKIASSSPDFRKVILQSLEEKLNFEKIQKIILSSKEPDILRDLTPRSLKKDTILRTIELFFTNYLNSHIGLVPIKNVYDFGRHLRKLGMEREAERFIAAIQAKYPNRF